MKKKYLVIGGHGFIGSHFCKKLSDTYDIYDINKPTGNPSDEVIRLRKEGLTESISYEDIQNNSYEYIVHFGAFAGPREKRNPSDYLNNNCFELMSLVLNANYKKMIYISSSSVLGDAETPYKRSKILAEKIITLNCKNHVIFRPFTVYGDNGRPDMLITRCINKEHIIVNGNPDKIKRRYTFVGDVVDAILESKEKSGVYNLVGEHEYTIKDVLNIFECDYTVSEPNKNDFKKQKIEGKCIYLSTKLEDFK